MKAPPTNGSTSGNDDWSDGSLADLCSLVSDQCDPAQADDKIYVGLEHIDSGAFALSRHGSPKDVVSAKNRFKKNDILYGKLRPYLNKAVVAQQEGICSTDILVFRPREKVCPLFVLAHIHSKPFVEYAAQTTHGVNHPRTSWAALKEFQCAIPPFSEQEKIAAVLRKIQKAVEIEDAIVHNARDLKKSLLRRLFTHGLIGADSTELDGRKAPSHWRRCSFFDFATLHRGYDLPVQDRLPGKVPIVGSNGIVGYHSIAKRKGPGVATGRSGTMGLSFYIESDYWPLNTALYVEDFHSNHPLFVHYFFQSFDFERFSAGVSVPTLNRNLVHEAMVAIPEHDEQREIANILQTVDRKIDIHESKKRSMQEVFKTMLHKLMTAQIRVNDLDIDTSEIQATEREKENGTRPKY
jgi:type I restriction enzyme S subunit